MHKDFDRWNKLKKQIHERNENRLYHEREIWWCSIGVNVGSEQDGSEMEYRRPVLILHGFSSKTCFVIPLTTATKKHALRPAVGRVDRENARALLSQMRVIDTRRLVRKIGYLNKEIFERIRKAAKDVL